MLPQREFLGWDRPLVELVVDWLWQRKETMPGLLVVVPTAQSGRLLREALAERGACLTPRIVTPDSFFQPTPGPQIASPLEERYAWIDALRSFESGQLPALFPVEPAERSFQWAASVCDELLAAWDTLAEGRRSFQDVRRESPEPERWHDISLLHRAAVGRLNRWGRQPRAEAKAKLAASPQLPPGVREVVIAGVPDPSPLAVWAWERLEDTPIRALIHAPAELTEAFDDWGRPIPDAWTTRPVPLGRERIHLVASPPELAAEAVKLCAARRSDQTGVALCDAAFGPALEAAFNDAGWKTWNPAGRATGQALAHLLRGLSALGRPKPPPWPEITALLRSPLLEQALGESDMFAALAKLDLLEKEYLPDTLGRLRSLIEWHLTTEKGKDDRGLLCLGRVTAWLLGWQQRFASGSAADALLAWTAEMRQRAIDDGAGGAFYELLEAAAPQLSALEGAGLEDPVDAIELALTGSQSLRSLQGRDEAVLDLPGWLELSFERAPFLVLAGLHDGSVPDGRMDDAFLPDGVRDRLELRHSRSRHARDAFLLHALAASRRVEVLVAKVDALGEPCRPSRLLLAASGRDLAERVRQLAAQPPSSGKRLSAWKRGGWMLNFDRAELVGYLDNGRSLSPSALRDYLHCPFRFYLKRLLKWDRYEAGKLEMNARDFGTVCHAALEAMGQNEEMKRTVDVRALSDFLTSHFDSSLRQRYGGSLSLPLMVQREAAFSRLQRFAEVEVEDRRDGWEMHEVEIPVGSEKWPWTFDGQPINMQIDRIDIHPRLGMRVLDYKSSAKADRPDSAHLKAFSERRRTYATPLAASGRGREKVWKNVQLPLYAAYVRDHFQLTQPPMVGYVNLPATLNDIEITMWNGFDGATLENALDWTRGAIEAMQAKVHWPPVELTAAEAAMDDFASLAPDGLADAVDGRLIELLKEAAADYDAARERGAGP